jgi:histidine triad (HIT) family protein
MLKADMTDNCLFCRIAAREVAAHVLHEDGQLMAFLGICPIRPGHALIVPKQHHCYFDDMPADLAGLTITLGQKLAVAMKRIYGVPRVAFLFTGGDLPHAHAHVVPMHEKTDITSRLYIAQDELTFRDTPRMPNHELSATAEDLVAALRTIG